jgi:predicted Zn-dependent peptidase
MEFKKKKLANGLALIGEVNKSAKSAAVGFFVKTGSRDESKAINGVSHYLEHMVFKGTERLNAFEVNEAFDRTGAKFNAFTSEENTLRDEDFNIEKNVIKEEIAMYKDLPSFDVMDKCRSLHFGEHPCGNSVLGTEESIDSLTAEEMRDYFCRRYASNNMIVAFAGNFNWGQVSREIATSCGKWKKQDAGRELKHCPGSRKGDRTEKPNLTCEHICLMSPAVSAQDSRRFAASLLSIIVGDDVGSRFFWELVDKALAEAATMQFGPMDGTGTFYSYIRCSSKNTDTVLETVKCIFGSLTNDGITEDELKKAKNKVLSALVIKNELPMGRLTDLAFNWIYSEQYRTIEDDIKAIRAVTVDDIHSLIEEFNPSDFTQFSIGPT